MKNLRTSYLDMVLIHWPGVKGLKLEDPRNLELRRETYLALEKMYEEGFLKFIGVSNYTLKHLEELFTYCSIKPHLNQVEFHPLLNQTELIEFCNQHSIIFQAYSSLGTSDQNLSNQLVNNQLIIDLAEKYSKNVAQILLKWAVQQNISVIPKSTKYENLKANINIFYFNLSQDDMLKINSLNQNLHLCWNPETVS
jgi:diketogulonate reductase-like aldo/keto reductase